MIAGTIPFIPKPVVRRVARRYVAGATLDEALAVVAELNQSGCSATLDVLGEFIEREEQADTTRNDYIAALQGIAARKLDCNVSVKLTAFGLLLDLARTLERVRSVVTAAEQQRNFVRIDMEDSKCTSATIAVFRTLRTEGRANVGLVLQAYMKRTQADIDALADIKPSYRLCKGIYVEPADIAFKGLEPVRENYRHCLKHMFATGATRVGIATHDAKLVEDALGTLRNMNIARERYEFQMLLGVTEHLRARLVREGHPVRVYVPFGHDWYGYCTRRLKENPKIASHVAKALFGLGG
ncbi:MAG: proline dehydrogenase [Planctomycetes bacterium]|nr:proline dehydrogenase [Planctomycetota bacterium]